MHRGPGFPVSSLLGLAVAATAAASVDAPSAQAFSVSRVDGDSGPIVRWHQDTVSYRLHEACSEDLPTAECLDEARTSFDAWSAPCSALAFDEQGLTSNDQSVALGFGQNGQNELVWVEGSQWPHGQYVLGVTSPVFTQSGPSAGAIQEADIAFNGFHHEWSTTGSGDTIDLKSVAVHEIGHFFGLQHVLGGYDADDPPTMAPQQTSTGAAATPEPDDLDGLCFLHPTDAYTCSSDADCPYIVVKEGQGESYAGQLPCNEGSCGDATKPAGDGDGELGEPCTGDADCESSLHCQLLSGTEGVCTRECEVDADDCPAGFQCAPYSNQPEQGVCLDGQGGGGGDKELGEPCQSGADCESELCVEGPSGATCRQPCDDDADCPDGQTCASLSGSAAGACADGGGGGDKELGEPCQSGADCESELCVGQDEDYRCRAPCTPGSEACPDGFACLSLSGGGGACLPSEDKGLGAPCQAPNECASGECVALEGSEAPFCTASCQGSEDCPCGMECVPVQGGDQLCAIGTKDHCVPNGEPCTSSQQCDSGLCHDGVCAVVCSIFAGGAPCDEGEGCRQLTAGSTKGRCAERGETERGGSCQSHGDCASLFCHEGACAEPCDPFAGVASCPGEQTCEQVGDRLGLCREPTDPSPTPDADAGTPDTSPSADTGSASPADAGPSPTQPETGSPSSGDASTGPSGGSDASSSPGASGGCRAAGPPAAPSVLVALWLAALLRPRRRHTDRVPCRRATLARATR